MRSLAKVTPPPGATLAFGDSQHSVYGMYISLNTSTYLSNNNDNNVLNISFNLRTVKFTQSIL